MITQAELVADLRASGVREGETLLVQSSTRAIGPVAGGSAAVVAALLEALGPTGTLVVYTATPENSDTSPLHHRAIAGLDPEGVRRFRAAMPAFDPARTPASPTMGRIAEEVRLHPGAVRSAHPQTSFAAVGPAAERITAGHPLRSHLGEDSPVHRLYRDRARALLVGVPVWCCTPLHLAEYWQPDREPQTYGCVVRGADGAPVWEHFRGLRLSDAHFAAVGEELARLESLRHGRLGEAHCFLLPIRDAVECADKWLRNRPA
ncbi:aminoglycoside N(3)-acetyltransferase [Kitasatospora camelliae]|uniref:Aminoglycoside N(3)-acetyltransferase n=1 Tax=Kitasatospora camelliae TaxID=3156397 RepID=A0AAU8JX63_9ACTN